jgi:hypothetical protein
MWPFSRRRARLPHPVVDAFFFTQEAIEASTIRIITVMTAEFDKLKAAVEAQDAVDASIIELLTNLGAQIRQKADDPAALIELAAHVESQSKKLADAVVANTPASTEAPDTNAAGVNGGVGFGSEQSPNGGPGATVLDGQPLDLDNPTAGTDANQSPAIGEKIDATKIEPAEPARTDDGSVFSAG